MIQAKSRRWRKKLTPMERLAKVFQPKQCSVEDLKKGQKFEWFLDGTPITLVSKEVYTQMRDDVDGEMTEFTVYFLHCVTEYDRPVTIPFVEGWNMVDLVD